MKNNKVELFLDSGAFSAWTQKITIDIQEYIAFIKEHEDIIDVHANLDVIGNARATLKNQKIMERAGLTPIPCFHAGEDFSYLSHYVEKYDYIALGGVAQLGRKAQEWMDRCFTIICDTEDRMPRCKVHGFGVTAMPLLFRYPWYSVDSTSWVMTSRLGSIQVPRWKNNKWMFDKITWKVSVSSKSPDQKEAGKHFTTLTIKEKELVLRYIEEKGYEMGKSSFRTEREGYELQENERWAEKKTKGPREVEKIEERGLCNDYKLRDEISVLYYLDLEKSLPEWPWPFLIQPSGFGL